MSFAKKEYKKFNRNSYSSYILGGDIGGTNTNLGIFGIKNNFPVLLASFHFKSKELKGLHYAINETIDYIEKTYKITITKACIAVAGVLSSKKNYVKTQNILWDVNKNELRKKTKLKKIILINDFEAVGYGINTLTKKDIFVIKKAKKIPKAPILVIGAGSGLGKTTLLYNGQSKSYIPVPSEAGHSDFPAQTQNELDLINFIKKYKRIKQSIPYEGILSGHGLSNIYLFLRKNNKFKETRYAKEIAKSNYSPELISKYRKIDNECGAAFEMFRAIYAKFARNFAIDCLAFGGVYIAGGIAPKNKDIFDKNFVKIFENNYKLNYVLKKMPVYLILNCNVGLIGAAFAGTKIFT